MPESKAPIDFASGQNSSNEALGGAIPRMMNVLVDGVGAIHVRPGISAWSAFGAAPSRDASTSVDGISVWNGYPVYVTSDRRLHAQLASNYGVDISDATAATQLDGGSRPVLLPMRTRVIVAGGGVLQKWEGGALSVRLGGGPPPATHVATVAQRLFVNPVGLSGQIAWSGIGDVGNEDWSSIASGFYTADSASDPLPAIAANTNEIIALGTASTETLDPSIGADNLFTLLKARAWTQGSLAPYSVAQNDETFAFLDALKRIQLSNGRSYTPISDPGLTADLENLSVVTDCWGFRMKIDSWDLLGWRFPTAGRTFVYNTSAKTWTEWGGFAGGGQVDWIAKSLYRWNEQKLNLVGLGDGTIAKMDSAATADMGAPIVAEVVSGFSDDGTDNQKMHLYTRFKFKRGLGAFGAALGPVCQLFWRDGTGAWEGPESLDLGAPDDTDPVLEVRSLGVYRTRQWRLRMSDSVPLTFMGAINTFEVLEQ